MAAKQWALAATFGALLAVKAAAGPADGTTVPPTVATALDGHQVNLPRDLPDHATVLILGFGRHSSDATTAWEKPVRAQLAQPGKIGFYDMAMLQEVPGFVRPFVLRVIKHAVPDVLKPHFLPLLDHEEQWKRAAGYEDNAPQAAYIMLVDEHGNVRWSTHQAYSGATWQQLTDAANALEKPAQ